MRKILIVDDSSTDRMIVSNLLSDYHVLMACDGLEAMRILEEVIDIDLIVLDLNMPNMNGFEVLTALNDNPSYKNIVTIILTNFDETENEIRGLNLGAVDYIRKPLNLESLKKRIEVHLSLKEAKKKIEEHNEQLEEIVANRTDELVYTRDTTIHALIGLLEVRNLESSNHTIRTQWMMKRLCEHLKTKSTFSKILDDDYINELFKTAPLHDIGKVGIPDSILLKPGRLNQDEFEIMKKHVTYGVEALSHHTGDGKLTPSFIKTAIDIVGNHHEKYNGMGYPKGLTGDSIPLPGRLMAIIDVYDALTSKRVYKDAYTHEEAIEMIGKESGQHFDPLIVSSFLEIQYDILEISREYRQDLS
ncbi:MAG: two-component system response regulator [Firmicutes bacterium HGW-Firmicutes-5]|nr:MAG: two-component system response regulator [Firmicutes bacterium HGW-Firmicutes-5]